MSRQPMYGSPQAGVSASPQPSGGPKLGGIFKMGNFSRRLLRMFKMYMPLQDFGQLEWELLITGSLWKIGDGAFPEKIVVEGALAESWNRRTPNVYPPIYGRGKVS